MDIKKGVINNYNLNEEDQLDENKALTIFMTKIYNNNNSIISELFYGVQEIKIKCSRCKTTKYNFQSYNFLEFPLKEINKYLKRGENISTGKNPDIDLYECFEYFERITNLTGDNNIFCNLCNCLNDAEYSIKLYSLPNDLILHLNRGRGATYECNVNFPEKIDLSKYSKDKKNTFYELYAVICHVGPSSDSGHFFAYCKNRMDDKWYKYNDAFVNECKAGNDYTNCMPYILFYRAVK